MNVYVYVVLLFIVVFLWLLLLLYISGMFMNVFMFVMIFLNVVLLLYYCIVARVSRNINKNFIVENVSVYVLLNVFWFVCVVDVVVCLCIIVYVIDMVLMMVNGVVNVCILCWLMDVVNMDVKKFDELYFGCVCVFVWSVV